MDTPIKPWKPKRTFKDIIADYGNEITDVECDNDQIYVTLRLDYEPIPEDICESDLLILVAKLNETFGANFSIVPRAKWTNN